MKSVLDTVEEIGQKSKQSLTVAPRPFLRWAGSKQKLLSSLIGHLPKEFSNYIEPFLGGGAIFFLLRPTRAIISDASVDLVRTYRAVRDAPEAVLRHLQPLKPLNREQYYRVRSKRSNTRFKRAAEFIYLNRACWNGIYRVNMKGQFNVPYGSPLTNFIVDSENLRACARAMKSANVKILDGDFESIVDKAVEGDFVFLDPPYVTGHNNNGFIDYNRKLFNWADQVRLAEVAHEAADRGARVMITNANHDSVLNLYPDFNVVEIKRYSTLAGRASSRRVVTEALIKSY